MKNYQSFLSENFQFLELNFSVYLNRCVFVMLQHMFFEKNKKNNFQDTPLVWSYALVQEIFYKYKKETVKKKLMPTWICTRNRTSLLITAVCDPIKTHMSPLINGVCAGCLSDLRFYGPVNLMGSCLWHGQLPNHTFAGQA